MKALLTAAEVGNVDTMKNIVDAIEEFEMTQRWMTQGDGKGRAPLHFAAIYGYMNVVRFIMKEIVESTEDTDLRKQYINLQDNKGRTPLFHAVAEGRLGVARFLIEHGADLELVTNETHNEPGSTLLMACAEKNTWECFNLILEKGADIMAVRKDGADATYIAARYGHFNIIQKIAETSQIKDIVNRPTFRGRTALLTAAFHGHIKVCKLLFSKGLDINHQDDEKFTALIYAANQGHFDLVKWLVENEAKVRIKDNYGETALTCAEANGHTEIARFLQRWCDDADAAKHPDNVLKNQGKGKRRGTKVPYMSDKVLTKKEEMKRMSR